MTLADFSLMSKMETNNFKVFEESVFFDTFSLEKGHIGSFGGLVKCRICGKKRTWWDWGYPRNKALTWLCRHLEEKHKRDRDSQGNFSVISSFFLDQYLKRFDC